MGLLSSATVLRLVDSMAISLAQAYQLARARLASAASPIVRLLAQPDHAFTEDGKARLPSPYTHTAARIEVMPIASRIAYAHFRKAPRDSRSPTGMPTRLPA